MNSVVRHLIDIAGNTPIIRYLTSGGLSFVVEIITLYILINLVHLPAHLGVAISFWIGLIVSFVLQKIFTFSDTNTSRKRTGMQIASYGALVLFNYAFTILFVYIGSQLPVIITRTIALAITTTWNYFLYKYWIFSK